MDQNIQVCTPTHGAGSEHNYACSFCLNLIQKYGGGRLIHNNATIFFVEGMQLITCADTIVIQTYVISWAAGSHDFHMKTRRQAQCQIENCVCTQQCAQSVWTYAVLWRIFVEIDMPCFHMMHIWFKLMTCVRDVCHWLDPVGCHAYLRSRNNARVLLLPDDYVVKVLQLAHMKLFFVMHADYDACLHVSRKHKCIMCIV